MTLSLWLTLANLATPAHAVDVDSFRPAASLANGLGSLQVESPELVGYGPVGGFHLNVAENMLVTETAIGNIERTIDSTTLMTAYGGYVFERKARLDFFVPFYGYMGIKPLSTSDLEEFTGAALGDIRAQVLIPILEPESEQFALSLIPRLGIPTGSPKALVAQGPHAGLTTSVGGVFPTGFGYLANLGLTLAPKKEILGTNLGSTLDISASGDYRISDLDRIGFEVDARVGLNNKPTNTIITGHAFAQKRMNSGWGMTVGLGTGLLGGIGSPTVRLFAGLSYALSIIDHDRDTFEDFEDNCPDVPEDVDGFEDEDGCPELDNDADGIEDDIDECPNDAEDYDAFIDNDGCPELDNDGDGVPDDVDKCPLTQGASTLAGCPDRDKDSVGDGIDSCPDHFGDVNARGCPDKDKDGISDFRDRCPNAPPPIDEPKEHSDGCPKSAYATLMSIQIQDPIQFKLRTAQLEADSKRQLRQVFRALKEAQRIELVQITGHTDNDGEEEQNLQLSQDRAEAVMTFLTRMGIAPERLVANGLGENLPIDTNRTPLGRANNNRIEFSILRQTISRPGEIDIGSPEEELAAQKRSGKLSLVIHYGTWAHVYINNKKIGPKAPFEDYELSPGDHLLWVANPATGLDSTQTIEIIPGHQVIIHIGTPKDLYARTKTAYGIQFTEAQEAPEELEDVVLPWTLPKEEAPSKSKAQEALERELREYPSSQ